MVADATAPAPVPCRSRAQAAVDKAVAKAHEQARVGNLPALLRSAFHGGAIHEVWSVGSRSAGGAVYTVDLRHDADGIETLCDCAANEAHRVCWHRASVRLAHADTIACHRACRLRFRRRRA